jgi:nitric oxide reductase NorQ protein
MSNTTTNATPYSVLITSQSPVVGTLRQYLVVANSTTDVRVWTRTTNGGRGESNAWNDTTYQELLLLVHGDENIVGEVLSSPLSDVDVQAITSDTRPNILLQKLTKQFGLRQQTISTNKLADVVVEVEQLISQNPVKLSKYRSDGRSDKSAIAPTTTAPQSLPVQVVRVPVQQPLGVETSVEVIGDFVALVPSAESVSGYVTRTFDDGVSEVAFYDFAIKNKINIMIEGEAGTGKTTSAKHYAYVRGLPFYSFSSSVGAEYSQLFGKVIIGDDGKPTWQDGAITQLWKTGGVLLIDEANFLPPKLASALHNGLDDNRNLTLLDHKGEVIKAHPNLLVLASYNEGYRGTNKMNQAFADRFTKLKFAYDINIEKKFIPSKSLLELFQSMRADAISGLYETPLSTRLLKKFVLLAKEVGYNFAVTELLNNFADDERGSVRMLFEAKRHNIMSELGFTVESISVDTGDEALVNN